MSKTDGTLDEILRLLVAHVIVLFGRDERIAVVERVAGSAP